MSASDSSDILPLLRLMENRKEEKGWWPGNPDEVIIGAILTQRTKWENVEQGLRALRARDLCRLDALAASPLGTIEDTIRCTGFYRVKAKRLRNVSAFIMDTYRGVSGMKAVSSEELRKKLLSVDGIGEETADSILCYALERCSFVIDRYTERICSCVGVLVKGGTLKSRFEMVLPRDPASYQRVHGQFVEYAKEYCVVKRCKGCEIAKLHG